MVERHPASTFRPDIEGLRAVAVVAVVAYHAGASAIPGGFVGVDIFFVISGYLITSLLLAELRQSNQLEFRAFYGRRARRLLPASLTVVVVTLAAALLLFAPAEQTFVAKGAIAASAYVSNFWFMSASADYFAAENSFNPFLHTWSLAVEEQFYLLWPALLLLLWRCRLRAGGLAIAIAALSGLSFLLCLWLTHRQQPIAFYSSPTRGWEFGVGALACLPPVGEWARRSKWTLLLGWAGALGLAAALLLLGAEQSFPGWVAVLPVLATAALLIAGAGAVPGGRQCAPVRLLKLGMLQWTGARSYSIYLWHWPILVFASALHVNSSKLTVALCIALTIACASLSYTLIENPVRRSAWLAAVRLRSIGLGVAMTLAGLAFGGAAVWAARSFEAHPAHAMLARQVGEPPLAGGSRRGCVTGFLSSHPSSCEFGSRDSDTTIVLIGDSHADQWSTPLGQLASEYDWRLVTMIKPSCAMADLTVYMERLRRFSPECSEWRRRALAEMARLEPDLVIIAQYSSGYVQGPRTRLGDRAFSHEEWGEGLDRTVRIARVGDAEVLLLRDSPTPVNHQGRCLARARWHGRADSHCDVSRDAALDPRITQLEQAIAEAYDDVHFGDLSDRFCSDVCPAVLDGLPVYRDGNHLTTAIARKQIDVLRDLLHSTGALPRVVTAY